MMKSAGGLLLAAVLLAGCGDNGAAKKEMNAKFRRLDYRVSAMETLNAGSTTNLETATQEHIALVHEYADELGADEARQRLVAKGDELGGYCLPCRATLYDEARKY
jgi:predicted component of type VI protein secretion system